MPNTAAALTFDKNVYSPGDTITATLTITTEDPAPRAVGVSGEGRMSDGQTFTFAGSLVIDGRAAELLNTTINETGGLDWSVQSSNPRQVVWTATA